MVLGERDRALAALADARRALAGDAQKLAALEAGIAPLGLEARP
jgi:cytochrome c-type biogenesis protein CcmH